MHITCAESAKQKHCARAEPRQTHVDAMATGDTACAGSVEVLKSFTELWDELYETINSDGMVSPESAGLVIAMAHLELHVAEDQVVKSRNEVLPLTRNTFTKKNSNRFLRQYVPTLRRTK